MWSISSHTTLKERKKDKNCPLLGKYFLLQRNKRALKKASYCRVVEKEVALKSAGFIYNLPSLWTIEYKFMNWVHEQSSWTIEYIIYVHDPSWWTEFKNYRIYDTCSWTEFMNWVHEPNSWTIEHMNRVHEPSSWTEIMNRVHELSSWTIEYMISPVVGRCLL